MCRSVLATQEQLTATLRRGNQVYQIYVRDVEITTEMSGKFSKISLNGLVTEVTTLDSEKQVFIQAADLRDLPPARIIIVDE